MTVIGSSDLDVFPLGLGGNTFGWTSDKETSFAVLDAFVAGGGNHIDSADSYSAWVPGNSGGESESIIGEWLAARGNRESVIIGTKVGRKPDVRGISRSNVLAAADASLARLKTDYIDLYYVHGDDNPDLPLDETVSVFHDLQQAGKIRYVALSNFTAPRLREWFSIATAAGYAPPVAFQPHYNLMERTEYESSLAPTVAEFGLGVLPYYALASGFLAGKYRTASDNEGAERHGRVATYLTPTGLAVLAALDTISAEHGVEPATVALAWLRSRPNVVAPLASASRVDQLPALLASATLDLSSDEIEALDKASAQ